MNEVTEQERARDAMERVKEVAGLGDKLGDTDGKAATFKSRYRSYVERLGPAIVMNGLGQALASELAAAGGAWEALNNPGKWAEADVDVDKRAHCEVYRSIERWLCSHGGVYATGQGPMMKRLMSGDQQDYLYAQAETLAWLEWHKKFCRASLPKD